MKSLSVDSKDKITPIYERHVDMLYRVCFAYMKNSADTQDMVQDTFIKLMQTGVSFENAEHEKAWLLRVAINLCKNALKFWWQKRESIEDYQDLSMIHNVDEILKTVIDLPTQYKDVVYLYYYEGYNTPEIAAILKKPQSTVRNHLHEARELLRGVLENEE